MLVAAVGRYDSTPSTRFLYAFEPPHDRRSRHDMPENALAAEREYDGSCAHSCVHARGPQCCTLRREPSRHIISLKSVSTISRARRALVQLVRYITKCAFALHLRKVGVDHFPHQFVECDLVMPAEPLSCLARVAE